MYLYSIIIIWIQMRRRFAYLISLLIGVALFVKVGVLFYTDYNQHVEKERLDVFFKLSGIKTQIENQLNDRLQLADAIKSLIAFNPHLSQNEFNQFTGRLLTGINGVEKITLAFNNKVTHVYPASLFSSLQGENLLFDTNPAIRSFIKTVHDSRNEQISSPILLHGQKTLLIATPISRLFPKDQVEVDSGLILIYVNCNTLIKNVTNNPGFASLNISLTAPNTMQSERIKVHGDTSILSSTPVLINIPVPNNYWQIAATPVSGWTDSPNKNLILFGGGAASLVTTLLLFGMVYLLNKSGKDREKYRYLIQNAKSIILRLDLSGRITFCNEYADSFFGFEPGELLGKKITETIIPSRTLQGEPTKRYINRLLDNPEATPFNETRCHRKNGEFVWVAWANKPVISAEGTMKELLCVGTDINDRKLMEEAQQKSERQYKLLAQNVRDIIIGLDAKWHYTYASPSDETLRGYHYHDLLGQSIIAFLTPQSSRLFLEATETLLSRIEKETLPPATTLDLEFSCTDGSTVWLEIHLVMLLNEKADCIGLKGVGRDISDRKRAEMLKEDMERMAQHDLKTPLGAVVGLPSEIKRIGGLVPVQESLLNTIEEAGNSMLQLINRSLDLYKMETNQYVLEKKRFDVVPLLQSLHKETHTIIRDKGISVIIDLPENATNEPFYIVGEEPLIRSVLANIFTNALYASPTEGSISITLRSETNIQIIVRNRGEVPLDMRENFFEKYTSSSEQGSGLGTYSARLIARTHGGDITVDTATAGETRIVITLPK